MSDFQSLGGTIQLLIVISPPRLRLYSIRNVGLFHYSRNSRRGPASGTDVDTNETPLPPARGTRQADRFDEMALLTPLGSAAQFGLIEDGECPATDFEHARPLKLADHLADVHRS